MAGRKYEKYIITKPKPEVAMPGFRQDQAALNSGVKTPVVYLDDEIIKGAFYVECVWFWKAMEKSDIAAHTHPFDEVITFFGSNPEDPADLCGEVEIWLEDEQYILNKSCLIFIPRGMKHCPLVVRRVDRPIFHFSAGSGGSYG